MARPTGRRRLIELGKDLLILLLACSSVLLAARTPMFRQLRGWAIPAPPRQPVEARPGVEALLPYALAVRNDMGLYGISYDPSQLSRAFDTLLPFLTEALSTAQQPQSATQRQWAAMLDLPGAYFLFQGSVPLDTLAVWSAGAGGPQGQAQALVLCRDGSQVRLGWRDGDNYYQAAALASYEGRLDNALDSFAPNGAAFAGTLAASDEAYAALEPWVLIPLTTPQPREYTVAAPDLVSDASSLDALLRALGFQSTAGSAYRVGEELAVTEGGGRVRVDAAGRVVYHAGEENRFPVACAGQTPTQEEAARAAWELLERAMAPWKAGESFLLTGIEKTSDGWSVAFSSRLEGIPVLTGQEGWCGEFTVTNRSISGFTLHLRSYTATDRFPLLPGQRLAAAALGALSKGSGRLALCYQDQGNGVLTPGWTNPR